VKCTKRKRKKELYIWNVLLSEFMWLKGQSIGPKLKSNHLENLVLYCKLFIWLAVHNRCWTADHLTKRSLPHLEGRDHSPVKKKMRPFNIFWYPVCLLGKYGMLSCTGLGWEEWHLSKTRVNSQTVGVLSSNKYLKKWRRASTVNTPIISKALEIWKHQ
jgi:hypothetical protein